MSQKNCQPPTPGNVTFCNTSFITPNIQPARIPANASQTEGSTYSTINISSTIPFKGISVEITLNHTFVGDLDIYLITPNGTEVQMINRRCTYQQTLNITLSDYASNSSYPCPPNGGTYLPFEPFDIDGTFGGEGIWTLRIEDRAFEDVGWLQQWSLSLCTSDYIFSNVTTVDHTSAGSVIIWSTLLIVTYIIGVLLFND